MHNPKRSSQQLGFTLVEVTLIILVLGLIGLSCFQFLKIRNNKSFSSKSISTAVNSTAKKPTSIVAPRTTTYNDGIGSYSFSYPAFWKINTAVDEQSPGYKISSGTLTLPSGTEIKFSADYGGRGGVCEPKATDVPHAKGNECNTEEYFSKEKLSTYVPASADGSTPEFPIYLVTKKFTDPEGISTYVIGLLSEDPEYPIEANQPYMGYVLPMTDIDTHKIHIDIASESSKASFLNSSEAKQIESALRTFSYHGVEN